MPAHAQKPAKHGPTDNASAAALAGRLAYRLQPGDASHYKITALFSGHIPPFSQTGGPPINLRVTLAYTLSVKKQNADGAEVAFTVDEGDVTLLEKEPGPDGKSDPADETPLPLPLSQIQNALNVSAILRPDGSVAKVIGGTEVPVKIDLGFDLRKLFLLMLPVTFPNKPVSLNDTWNFDDGVLGHKPGKVTYTARLLTITPEAKRLAYGIGQNAEALIEDRRDKDGKPTDKPETAVDSTTGKVTVTGSLKFVAPAIKAADHAGHLAEGRLVLNALLTRKRTQPDPEHPEDPLETQTDIRGRLFVQAEDGAKKPAKPEKTAANPVKSVAKGKDTPK